MKQIIKRDNGSLRVSTVNMEKSLTQQQFKDATDINRIIAKYKKTGEFPLLTKKGGVYADLTNITDYHSMLNSIHNATSAFSTLPAALRLRFHNDPGELLAFLQDPNNREEGIKLGLVEPGTGIGSSNANEPNEREQASQPPPQQTNNPS